MISTKPLLPTDQNESDHRRKIVFALNNMLQGKLNNWGTVTLTVSSATTVVTDPRAGVNSVPVFTPTTANAATELATMYVSSRGDQTFTLTHANNSQADRTFLYAILG